MRQIAKQTKKTEEIQTLFFLCSPCQMDLEKTNELICQTEAAAQEIFISRDVLVALDSRRQNTREAFRALKNGLVPTDKVWVSIGDVFVKTRTPKAQNLMERGKY